MRARERDVCPTISRVAIVTDPARPWDEPRRVFLQVMQTPQYLQPITFPRDEGYVPPTRRVWCVPTWGFNCGGV